MRLKFASFSATDAKYAAKMTADCWFWEALLKVITKMAALPQFCKNTVAATTKQRDVNQSIYVNKNN